MLRFAPPRCFESRLTGLNQKPMVRAPMTSRRQVRLTISRLDDLEPDASRMGRGGYKDLASALGNLAAAFSTMAAFPIAACATTK